MSGTTAYCKKFVVVWVFSYRRGIFVACFIVEGRHMPFVRNMQGEFPRSVYMTTSNQSESDTRELR